MNADQLTALLRRLVPDWAGRPMYVVLASNAPPPDLLPPGAWGCYGQRFDLSLRPWLDAAGRWEGRGPALYVDDAGIRGEAAALAGDDTELAVVLFGQRLLGTALHEAAHALEAAFDYSEPSDDAVVEAVEGVRAFVARDRKPAPPMAGHDMTFVRIALHLVARLERLTGERLPLNLVVNAGIYALSHPVAYRAVLRDEIETFPTTPFAALRRLGPPAAAMRLFEADVAAWFGEQKH